MCGWITNYKFKLEMKRMIKQMKNEKLVYWDRFLKNS